jgi:NAD(P)-dependent dehydrogenase (short-subunit alcohol dehydrogenase family)
MRATCQDLAVTPGACEAVHTAAVCPGFVDTPMLREHLGWAGAGAEEEKVWHSNPAPPLLPRIIVPPPRRPSQRRQQPTVHASAPATPLGLQGASTSAASHAHMCLGRHLRRSVCVQPVCGLPWLGR